MTSENVAASSTVAFDFERQIAHSFHPLHQGAYDAYVAGIFQESEHQILGICGGSGSGKSILSERLVELIGPQRCTRLNVDGYLRYPREVMKQLGLTGFDPESRDMDLFRSHLDVLRRGGAVDQPTFDEATQEPAAQTERVPSRDKIVIEDTLDFTGLADMTVFLYAPDEILVERRVARDVQLNGYWNDEELRRYLNEESLPKYHEAHLPIAEKCDIVIDTVSTQVYANPASDINSSAK
jgi:uridine kinase